MRKTQVALAALALVASTAALADGVKVAGCVDASLVNTTTGTVLGGAGDGCASQIGFYGASDTNGIKTGFNLETGFSTANGAMGNGGADGLTRNATDASRSQGVFNRLANVYIGNGMVTAKLGLQKSPWIEAAGGGLTAYGMNGVGVPGLAILNPNLSGTTQAGGFFVANGASVQINSGGIEANIMSVVNSESATNDSYTAARVSTSIGNASVNLGYEARKNVALANDVDYQNMVVSGALDLGSGFGLNAAYSSQSRGSLNATTTNASQKAYLIGGSYKMSDALGFGITYARNNQATAQKMFAISAQYNLSPTVALYANVSDFTAAAALNNAGTAEATGTVYTGKLWSVGMHKAF
jgi:hypothetical protein